MDPMATAVAPAALVPRAALQPFADGCREDIRHSRAIQSPISRPRSSGDRDDALRACGSDKQQRFGHNHGLSTSDIAASGREWRGLVESSPNRGLNGSRWDVIVDYDWPWMHHDGRELVGMAGSTFPLSSATSCTLHIRELIT